MKVNRIMMEYANYGLPTIEKKINENIAIHLWFNTFECGDGTFPFKKIKQILLSSSLPSRIFILDNIPLYSFNRLSNILSILLSSLSIVIISKLSLIVNTFSKVYLYTI